MDHVPRPKPNLVISGREEEEAFLLAVSVNKPEEWLETGCL